MNTDQATNAADRGSALSEGLGGGAPNWDAMFAALMIHGIAAKIQRGEPLTDAQQALKDAAPHGFKWPEPPNVGIDAGPTAYTDRSKTR